MRHEGIDLLRGIAVVSVIILLLLISSFSYYFIGEGGFNLRDKIEKKYKKVQYNDK